MPWDLSRDLKVKAGARGCIWAPEQTRNSSALSCLFSRGFLRHRLADQAHSEAVWHEFHYNF